jgi:P4 family phage/plasmid primase-like protien
MNAEIEPQSQKQEDSMPENEEQPESAAPSVSPVESVESTRELGVGSAHEMAQVLRGVTGAPPGPEFGVLSGLTFDHGALWRFEPKNGTWRVFTERDLYPIAGKFDGAIYTNAEGKFRNVQYSQRVCAAIARSLEGMAPRWPQARPVGLAFRNGFLPLGPAGAGALEPLGPEHYQTHRLDFDYDPAPAPETFSAWLGFLRSVWPDDTDSVLLLHQILGYLISGRVDMQKIFLFVGPPRSGKGTIAKVIKDILGSACGAFKLAELDERFALEPMVGRSVVIDSDVRRGKGQLRDEGKQVERCLSIAAQDVQTIQVKNRPNIESTLPARMLMMTNPPFALRDVGGAFASRLVLLDLPVSYLGREDRTLHARLRAELPAIVALALAALPSLDRAGRFVESATSADTRAEVELGQAPIKEFFDEWCEMAPGERIQCKTLYEGMKRWAEENGNAAPSSQSFASALKQRGVTRVKPRVAGERHPPHYVGIKLLPVAPFQAVPTLTGGLKKHGELADVIPITR